MKLNRWLTPKTTLVAYISLYLTFVSLMLSQMDLHLLLRVTDKLLQNVIDEVLEKDAVKDFTKPRGQPKGINLGKLVATINSLGISFAIWNKRNADGSESQIK